MGKPLELPSRSARDALFDRSDEDRALGPELVAADIGQKGFALPRVFVQADPKPADQLRQLFAGHVSGQDPHTSPDEITRSRDDDSNRRLEPQNIRAARSAETRWV